MSSRNTAPIACKPTAHGLPLLPNGRGEAIPSFDDDEANIVPAPANLFDLCPSVRLPFLHVTYGWDFEEDSYVLRYSDPFVLTRSEPTVPRPDSQDIQYSSCGSIEALVATDRGVPVAIPREVQDSDDPNAAALAFLQEGAPTLPYKISLFSYDEVKSGKTCKPPSPSA